MKSTIPAAISSGCLIIAAAGCTPGSSEPASTDLNLAIYTPETSIISKAVAHWAAEVEERTDGDVSFDLHYSASLLAADDSLQGVAEGRADAAMIGAVYYERELPLTSITSIPYVTDHPAAAMYALGELQESNPAFQAEYEKNGVAPVFFAPATAPLLGATGAPLNSVDGLEGVSVRSVGVMTPALEAAGANPVAIDYAELYEALERGVVSAYSGVLLDSIAVSGFHEVAPFVSDPGIGLFSTYPVVIRKEVWDSLPADTQQMMVEAGTEALERVFELEAEAYATACETIVEAGGTVTVWAPEEKARWQDLIGESIITGWRARSGDDAEAFEAAYRGQLEENTQTLPAPEDHVASCAAGLGEG
jgi:TRAP-type C4-dicarboxylate transport system substrate-binding protein